MLTQLTPEMRKKVKEEITAILEDIARKEGKISYSELAQQITTAKLDPHTELKILLGEVSIESFVRGEGLLSGVVVFKDLSRDGFSGEGFFTLARELGYKFTDEVKFWVENHQKVCACYKGKENQ